MYTITPGHFAVFSSLLAALEASEGRDNTKYKDAAVLTGNYLLNQIVDPDTSLALNVLVINGTYACTNNPTKWSRNTGNTLEAFSILADLTGDSKWTDATNKMIAAATTNTAWTGNDGVVTESSECCKHFWYPPLYSQNLVRPIDGCERSRHKRSLRG